jgi:hypothetical protein
LLSIALGLPFPDEIDSGVLLALFFPCPVRPPGAKVFVGALTFSFFPRRGEAESTAKALLASIKAAVSRARFLNIVDYSCRFDLCTTISNANVIVRLGSLDCPQDGIKNAQKFSRAGSSIPATRERAATLDSGGR